MVKISTILTSLALAGTTATAMPAGGDSTNPSGNTKPEKDAFAGRGKWLDTKDTPRIAIHCNCPEEDIPADSNITPNRITQQMCQRASQSELVDAEIQKHDGKNFCVMTKPKYPRWSGIEVSDENYFKIMKENYGHVTRCLGEFGCCTEYERYVSDRFKRVLGTLCAGS